jgi:hypothetical protein
VVLRQRRVKGVKPPAQRLFLTLILAQAAHSIEEYLFRLYDVMAPATSPARRPPRFCSVLQCGSVLTSPALPGPEGCNLPTLGEGPEMVSIPFDVNDPRLRESFIRDGLLEALGALRDTSRPGWGKMTAQQMVEHLEWSFEVSTGQARVDCPIPAERREKMKAFLYHNRPSPPEFMNPALVQGLPPLRHPSLTEAKGALRVEVDRFFRCSATDPGAIHTHPVFGPIGVEEWSRTHFKHGYHHLLQFGLIDREP